MTVQFKTDPDPDYQRVARQYHSLRDFSHANPDLPDDLPRDEFAARYRGWLRNEIVRVRQRAETDVARLEELIRLPLRGE